MSEAPTDIPPGQRCVMADCDREGVDPTHARPLCPEHHPDVDPEADGGGTDTGDDQADPMEGSAQGDGIDGKAGEPRGAPAGDTTTGLGETDVDPWTYARPAGQRSYPPALKWRDWWVNWVLAEPPEDRQDDEEDPTPTKQPVAPYDNGRARPVRWNSGLDEDEHPSTEFEEARPWAGWSTVTDLPAPDRVVSDEVGLGIIIPTDQPDANPGPDAPDHASKPVVLIDWDDVRDPETGEIHPVVGWALAVSDTYAEISQSGEGIHQFVFGEIPGGLKKFIRYIDAEVFVGDDRPAVEIYESGRLTAMTGRQIKGTGDGITDGQELVTRLCKAFGTGDNAGPGTPTDPFGRRGGDADETTDTALTGDAPDRESVSRELRDQATYDGDDPETWDYPSGRSLEYEAVLRARTRSDELAGVANWELIGYAAALGYQDGFDKGEILDHLQAYPTPQYGYDDQRARKEVRGVIRKMGAGNYEPPTPATLARRGILPDEYAPDQDAGKLVVLPDDETLTPQTDATDIEDGDGRRPRGVDLPEEPDYGELTLDHAQERTRKHVKAAVEGDDDVLVEALMSMGKSWSAARAPALADTDQPVTIVTARGRNEQYDQYREWADDAGFNVGDKGEPNGDVLVLPSFLRDCNSANGDHGDELAETIKGWYDAGATGQQIHKHGGRELAGESDSLPCQDGQMCDYARRWNFDPDNFAILIGHYSHLQKPKVTTDRTVIFDEYPGGSYEMTLAGESLRGSVTRYLREYSGLPFDSYSDLVHTRDDFDKRQAALAWLEDRGVEPDALGAIRFDGPKHALAPLAIYVILQAAGGGALGNGFERADLPNGEGVGVFEYDHGPDDVPAVHLLRRPRGLPFCDNVVALDGTPTMELWELATGREFTHRTVLEGRRAEYLELALNYRIVQTTDFTKPYNNHDHVNTDRDAALLHGIEHHHGDAPAVIATTAALTAWDDDGVIELDKSGDRWEITDGPAKRHPIYYGNLIGSNQFASERVGAVIGSMHYGDDHIARWGAYDGKRVPVGGDARQEAEHGFELDYGDFGNAVLQDMHNDTLQAIFRFGRDGDGATIYVETDVLPEWVPVHGRGEITTATKGLRDVIEALDERGPATAGELAQHDAVGISHSHVRDHIKRLRDLGVVASVTHPDDSRQRIHRLVTDDGTTVSPFGVADLPDEIATDDAADAGRKASGIHNGYTIWNPDASQTTRSLGADDPQIAPVTPSAKTDPDLSPPFSPQTPDAATPVTTRDNDGPVAVAPGQTTYAVDSPDDDPAAPPSATELVANDGGTTLDVDTDDWGFNFRTLGDLADETDGKTDEPRGSSVEDTTTRTLVFEATPPRLLRLRHRGATPATRRRSRPAAVSDRGRHRRRSGLSTDIRERVDPFLSPSVRDQDPDESGDD